MRHADEEGQERESLTKGDAQDGENVPNEISNTSSATLKKDLRSYNKKKWVVIGVGILILLILAIVLPIVLVNKEDNPTPGPTPTPTPTPFNPGKNPYTGNTTNITVGSDIVSGQIHGSLTNESSAQQMLLSHNTEILKKIGVDWNNLTFGKNNKFAQTLNFTFDMIDRQIARLVLTDADEQRFSIPEDILPKKSTDQTLKLDMLGFNFSSSPFEFSFTDLTDSDNVFFSTKNQTLVFGDKFIQMDFQLPTQRVYGLGERVHEFQLSEGAYTMWATGQDNIYDDGKGRKGLSGVHPFLLVQSGKIAEYVGIYFRNSNAQTPIIRYTDDGKSVLSYITIAGQLEVYFFIHGSAKEVIQSYQNFVGLPNLPPLWSLGWQEASYKDSKQSSIEESISSYMSAGLPLEAIYLDLNSLNNQTDFSLNTENINNITSLNDLIKNNSLKLVAYLSSAISVENTTNNKYYQNGNGMFIKTSLNYTNGQYNGNLVNMQALKKVVYIDWFNQTCSSFWNTGLTDYHNLVNFDGLWTTMNEPFGQIHGEHNQTTAAPQQEITFLTKRMLLGESEFNTSWYYSFADQNETSTFFLPFIPQYGQEHIGNYDNQTLSLNATHGSNNKSEYDLHSLYSLAMAQKTHNFLTNSTIYSNYDSRPFFLTKGTFSGSGAYASYAITNNWRQWSDLKYSISGIMNMNMYGIPHSGADICGFHGQSLDEELCLRWIQLATFYPLARHNQNFTYFENTTINRTEPFSITNETYKANVKASMFDRFQYLRLMYTCLFEASKWGGTCFDPLFFYFPIDLNVYDIFDTFMVAGAIKVSPIVQALGDNTTFQSYFPIGNWVNLANMSEIINSNGSYQTLNVQSTVNAHLRPGALIPFQNNSDYRVNNTNMLTSTPLTIIANRDINGYSEGSLFVDYGTSRKEISEKLYGYYKVKLQNNSVQFQIADGQRYTLYHFIDKIIIANAEDLVNTSFSCYYTTDMEVFMLNHTYNATIKSLELYPHSSTSLLNIQSLMNVYYGNSSDLNLCDPNTFQYTIDGGVLPNLTSQNASIKLKHQLLPSIQVDIGFFDEEIVNVRWSWALDADGKVPAGKRTPVEVPLSIVNTTKVSGQTAANLSQYLNVSDNPFRIDFIKFENETNSTYLSITGMIFDSYLNWINVEVYQNQSEFKGILGLGERSSKDLFFKSGVYSMWAKDTANPDEDGKLPGKQTYGTHPFYMYRHSASNWVGAFYKLAHAQDWWIQNNATAGTVGIKTIAAGGVADLYILTAQQKPDDVIAKYYKIVGKPVLIPQWSLGWNQCKWCYKNTSQIRDVVAKYEENNIPLDAQWVDIDYMDNYKDFTYDNKSFNGLPEFVNELHNKSMKFVPIMDAGIAYRPNQDYPAYSEGVKQNIFLKARNSSDPFIGEVWPNEAVYPDFTHVNSTTWWHSQLDTFYSKVNFDGLWQDMNEASNFCNGACRSRQTSKNPIKEKLIYTPTGEELETKGISMDVMHSDNSLELDEHSLFATRQVKASHEWFQNKNQRTMIISRSSFAGHGKFGSKWTGDNHATAEDMEKSVIQVMLMNMFGVSLVGSDICGFADKTTNALCARWHQVGAFYPFSRNHHACDDNYQEPYLFTDEYKTGVTYTDIMRTAIYTKYHLIRYFYSELLTQSYVGDKSFYKPLFFMFPDDMNAYENITNNIMIGNHLKLSINSGDLNATETVFYFPQGLWCNIFDPINDPCFNSTGQNLTKNTSLTDFYVHMYEGSIIPMQNATALKTRTTAELQKYPIDLHILGKPSSDPFYNWTSIYFYANDDGNTTQPDNKTNVYNITSYDWQQNSSEFIILNFTMIHRANDYYKNETKCSDVNQNDFLNTVYIYNAASFQLSKNYTVNTVYDDQTVEVGTADTDADSDRIIFKPTSPICMSRLAYIALRYLNSTSS